MGGEGEGRREEGGRRRPSEDRGLPRGHTAQLIHCRERGEGPTPCGRPQRLRGVGWVEEGSMSWWAGHEIRPGSILVPPFAIEVIFINNKPRSLPKTLCWIPEILE